MSDKLRLVISSTTALIEQFSSSLSAPSESTSEEEEGPAPLPLLATAAKTLKAQTTKLSLLAITAPFTPSALVSILCIVNESILPSLTAAALLTSTKRFTKSFQDEARAQTRTTLRELKELIDAVEKRSHADPSKDANNEVKSAVSGLTGRVWEACDELVTLADGGLVGFVVKRAEQYKALVQDAVKELEEWDPHDDEDDGFGDLLSDEEGDTETESDAQDAGLAIKMEEQKQKSLKVLSKIPQCIHVVIKNRLQKSLPTSPNEGQLRQLEVLQDRLQSISETVDEAAGSLYESNVDNAEEFTQKAKALTFEALGAVLEAWVTEGQGTNGTAKEDKYMQRAKEYIEKA